MKVLVPVIEKMEEIELLATVDILRRGNVEVLLYNLTKEDTITLKHDINIVVEKQEIKNFLDYDALFIAGGNTEVYKYEEIVDLVKKFDYEGKVIASICAGPTALGVAGVLKDKNYTCYTGFEREIEGIFNKKSVVLDGNILTACGAGVCLEFAYKFLEILMGEERKIDTQKQMLFGGIYD